MSKTLTRLADFLRPPRQQIVVTALRNESYRLAREDLAGQALAILQDSQDPAEAERRLLALLGQDTRTAAAA